MKRFLLLLAGALLCVTACRPAAPEGASLFPSQGARNVNPDTHLVLTFDGTPRIGESGFIRVYDAATDELVDCLDLSIPAGPTQGRGYGPECDYLRVPYSYDRTEMATNRNTVPGTPSCPQAEPTPPDYQLTIIGGFTDAFHFHPVIVHDNVATIYLHNNMLEYGHKYYVTIDPDVLVCGDFPGVKKGEWKFSTKKNGPADPWNLTVAADGSGDFNTVQGAFDFIPDFSERQTVVTVAAGDYEEIVYTRNKGNVKLIGASKELTRVHYPNNEVFNPHPLLLKTNEWPGTFPSRRAAFMLDNCHDITIEDMTIATDLRGQAEGILINGERIALYKVHIIGSGDAVQANGTIYMESCEVDGGGDTFLGRGTVFGYRCALRNEGGAFSYVRNTAGHHGDVFVECSFESTGARPADWTRTGTNEDAKKNTALPYPDAEFVVIDCKTKNFNPLGWSLIAQPTQRMYEYNTRDLDTDQPVDYSGRNKRSRQLDAKKDAELIASYRDRAWVLAGWKPFSYFD
ncbi:MAG: carbohydrate esterase [Bacteroidales bacterium]|nr:carbohydrate esterase [Bacteroidales bacterium]